MESIRLNTSAHKNPETAKPGTIAAASIIRSALITNMKSPKVNTVSGRVNIMNKGRTSALIRPSTSATTRATKKPVIATPGNI